jgi:hypothetical protein
VAAELLKAEMGVPMLRQRHLGRVGGESSSSSSSSSSSDLKLPVQARYCWALGTGHKPCLLMLRRRRVRPEVLTESPYQMQDQEAGGGGELPLPLRGSLGLLAAGPGQVHVQCNSLKLHVRAQLAFGITREIG